MDVSVARGDANGLSLRGASAHDDPEEWRMRQLAWGLVVFVVMVPTLAHAQLWTGILDRSRAVDWSRGHQGVAGGIPNRTTICATFNPGATASQINAAIAACPPNGVVFLNAGTYTISGLTFGTKSNVTLRGAGPTRTIVKFTSPDPCGGFAADICVKGADVLAQTWPGHAPEDLGQVRNWTGGYAQGATQITVDSTQGLSVGMTIVLDQRDSVTETGGVMISSAPDRVLENISTGRVGRGQTQWVRITGISGNTLTITPGLYMPNWRGSQAPQIWWAQGPTGNGIEDMTLDHSRSSATDIGLSGIVFWNTTQCWVTNVRSVKAGRNHVWLVQAHRTEIRDSYFSGADKPGGSLNYGIDFYMGGDSLVVNNIFQHITSSLMPGTTSGDILAYNFSRDQPYSNPDYMQIALNTHDIGNLMLLVEGNQTNTFTMDLFHGAGQLNTVFRNQLTGQDVGQTTNTSTVNLFAYNRFVNVVGNVLGTPGYHTNYETCLNATGCAPGNGGNLSIYVLGFSASGNSNAACCPYDPLVRSTMLRWGNYDTVTRTVRWVTSEVPGAFPFVNANPVPPQTLPASFFLSGKPSWWSTPWGEPAWPAVGPEVTGGNVSGVGGRVWKIPARLCWENAADDPAYPANVKIFDADACYARSAGPAPSAPTGVQVQ
jgi:hypothetical protein